MFPVLSGLSESVRIEAANLASLLSESTSSELKSHAAVDFVRRLAESSSSAAERSVAQARSAQLNDASAAVGTTSSETARTEFVVQCVHCYLRGVALVDGALVAAAHLTQASSLLAKRVGYLALRLFLAPPRRERSSELLVVASLQRDLTLRARPIEQCMALAAMDSLQLDVDVAPAVVPLLHDLMARSTNASVRVRAAVSLCRFGMRGVDIGSAASIAALLATLLGDASPSVLGAALVWLLELLEADAPCPIRSDALCDALLSILRQCLDFCLPAEYNAGAVAAPYIQIKLLRCIAAMYRCAALGNDVAGVVHCDAVPVLRAVVASLQSLPSATAAALLVECARTAAAIPNSDDLRRFIAETATPLLAAHSSDSVGSASALQTAAVVGARRMTAPVARAAALSALRYVGGGAFDKRLRQLVVECLETDDDTLQQLTLDLLSSVTNANNVAHIAPRMSLCARTAPSEATKVELYRQTVRLIVDHAPTPEWHAEALTSVLLSHGGGGGDGGGGGTTHRWLRMSPRLSDQASATADAADFLLQQLMVCLNLSASAAAWLVVADRLAAHDQPFGDDRLLELAALVATRVPASHALVARVLAVTLDAVKAAGALDAVATLAAALPDGAPTLLKIGTRHAAFVLHWRAAALGPLPGLGAGVARPFDPRAAEWIVSCGGDAQCAVPALDDARWRRRHSAQSARGQRRAQLVATPSGSPRTSPQSPMSSSRLKFTEPSPAMSASMSASSRAPLRPTAPSTQAWSTTGYVGHGAQPPAADAAGQTVDEAVSPRRDLARQLFGE